MRLKYAGHGPIGECGRYAFGEITRAMTVNERNKILHRLEKGEVVEIQPSAVRADKIIVAAQLLCSEGILAFLS